MQNRGLVSAVLATASNTSIITPGKEVWYHDGMVTRRNCIKKGHLTDFTENSFKTCVEKNSSGESIEQQAVVVISSKK